VIGLGGKRVAALAGAALRSSTRPPLLPNALTQSSLQLSRVFSSTLLEKCAAAGRGGSPSGPASL